MADSVGYCHVCRLVVIAPYPVPSYEAYYCPHCSLIVRMRPRIAESYKLEIDCPHCGLAALAKTNDRPRRTDRCPKCGSADYFERLEKC